MKYICVEGCIGVGKTTAATLLSSEIFGATLLLEDFEKHPFLNDFYSNPQYTFETELNFLLIHYHQIIKLLDERPKMIISDFSLYKDLMFAEANMDNSDELRIFRDLYEYLIRRIPVPNNIICLYADIELVYKRVLQRNRRSEKSITKDYLYKINRFYDSLFSDFERKGITTVKIDMNKNDFVANPQLISELIEKL